jgi:hypothetical protein
MFGSSGKKRLNPRMQGAMQKKLPKKQGSVRSCYTGLFLFYCVTLFCCSLSIIVFFNRDNLVFSCLALIIQRIIAFLYEGACFLQYNITSVILTYLTVIELLIFSPFSSLSPVHPPVCRGT